MSKFQIFWIISVLLFGVLIPIFIMIDNKELNGGYYFLSGISLAALITFVIMVYKKEF